MDDGALPLISGFSCGLTFALTGWPSAPVEYMKAAPASPVQRAVSRHFIRGNQYAGRLLSGGIATTSTPCTLCR